MASSSSPPRNDKKMYDVFVSFRGEDTRDNFTSHLFSALFQNNIETFIDNDLKRGDEISESLLGTIEASTISIIIFSERYASSKWCLDELLKILECKRNYGQIVIPVFYRVDPSHVRKQIGSFGDSFFVLEERFPYKTRNWRSALTEAANISGFDSRVIRPESKLVGEIANEVSERLDDIFQSENNDLVGVEWRIKEIESLLRTGSAGVYKLGIWGIGGIGKTTIAGAVFNKISRHFEGSYFAYNVRAAEETGRLDDLRKELLSKLLNDRNVENFQNISVNFQNKRLARKKVLIVFDDVSHPRQIELLIRRLDQFASGSRVIITTRDKHVLTNCEIDHIYQMKELVHAGAHKLFTQCAFRGDHLDAGYTELAHEALKYAQGVPLALKVLGCYLCRRSKEEWESAMRKLEIVPYVGIQEVLKISYDSLDDSQKKVFLYIASFLEGKHRDKVISFLDVMGFQAKIELSVLEGKSLITVDFIDRIRMHDLLRDMGREIVRKESIDHPGKCSRLWHHEDIYEVLKKNTGTKAIKDIYLNMSDIEKEIFAHTFSTMTKLGHLKFYESRELKGVMSDLEGMPFPQVYAENLVSLKMWDSKVKECWDDVQMSSQGERANWADPTYRKYFIDLCMREANNGNRSNATLKPTAWDTISQELKALIGKFITPKQLKNGWDYMKWQYLTWLKLTIAIGNGYNSTTRTFDWPPERWEEYLKKYPEAKQFRSRPLANVEELEALFSGVVATGAYNWNFGMEGIPEIKNISSMLFETPINLEDDDCEAKTPNSYTNVDEPLPHDMQRCKKKQKKSKSDETWEDINKLVVVLEKTNDKGPSITQCMPILRKLLTYDNPMYYVAINALCNKREYRELWMGMECDEERIGWIYSLPRVP